MEPKEQRKVDDFIIYAMAAADAGDEDAGWKADTTEKQERTGVLIGSGIGGLSGIAETVAAAEGEGPAPRQPVLHPRPLINLASGYVSISISFKGPNHAVVTACSTGAHAIGDAARLIALGDADVMVAGGAEARSAASRWPASPPAGRCPPASTTSPTKASRPYDKDRDGFVMGEGAGIVVLEELEHAKARGAKIYAEVIGYGLSGDAYHITAPAEDGDGAFRCMQRRAEARRASTSSDIDYVNAHGTSTPMGDEIELGAVERLFGNAAGKLAMSSTKSATGHLLGAAGAVEAIFSRACHPRQHRAADPQPRQPVGRDGDRPRAAQGQEARDRHRAVQLVRLRRHQRLADPAAAWPEASASPAGCRRLNRHVCAWRAPFAMLFAIFARRVQFAIL